MATPTYQVNGSITLYGVRSTWSRVPKRTNSDGTTDWQPYLLNVWDIAEMEESTFQALRALQGAALTSLATNAVEDRNNGDTYTDVELSIVNGSQVGRRITNVHLEFRVRI
jgi:hypothetical protein